MSIQNHLSIFICIQCFFIMCWCSFNGLLTAAVVDNLLKAGSTIKQSSLNFMSRRPASSFQSFLGPKLMGEFSDFSSDIRTMKAKRSEPEIKNESKFVGIRTILRFVLNLRVLPLRQQGTSVQVASVAR